MITVIIPCYNEIKTISIIIDKVYKQKLKKQIIVVDDYSTDGTRKILKKKLRKKIDKIILHNKNYGKGAAINSAKKFIKGNIIIIQDADLEYSPKDFNKLIKPIMDKKYNVVYGSRVLGKNRYFENEFSSIFRVFANHILTIISNILNNQNLTDAHTCYKVFDAKIFKKIKLEEKGFSFCPEVTTKISLLNEKIIEVPISYKGRGYSEGKKINFKDGFIAIKTLLKYRF
jgi:glycosyltransferase involved in cell wall biosynthesis